MRRKRRGVKWIRRPAGPGLVQVGRDGVDKALIAPDNLFKVSQADGLRIEDDELIRH